MSTLYQQFTTDPKLEKEGVLLEYGFNSKNKPITIRVARAGGANQQYAKRMEIKVKPYRRQIQTETIDKKQLEKLILEVFCETVVLGWENVEFPVKGADGSPTGEFEERPFSFDNAVQLFTDLPDLFSDVQESAQKSALFRTDIREANAGN
jgi:hypothetical protein